MRTPIARVLGTLRALVLTPYLVKWWSNDTGDWEDTLIGASSATDACSRLRAECPDAVCEEAYPLTVRMGRANAADHGGDGRSLP